jgi:PadR family transcriptional regulator, regulatory protein PadR
MAKGDYLGEFEHLVLLAIARAGGQAGGAQIHDDIERASKRGASMPAIYVTLGRLEKKGFVRTADVVPQEDGSGRPRRIFEVTRAGSAAMRATREVLERMWIDTPSPARPRR